jgi:pyruvate/2-oxoglutarate dehydrogenase complex dihydrolipoamide dehydrogenase (E3) component
MSVRVCAPCSRMRASRFTWMQPSRGSRDDQEFTHISIDDFRVVHDNLRGVEHVTTGRQVPYCLFTDRELARIGLNENEANAQDVEYRLFKVPMAAVLRAHTLSEMRGFLKALVEAEGDRILGFTAFGVGAGEIMAAVQIAMIAGLPYTALRDAVLTHPTLVEGLFPLFSSAPSMHSATAATAAPVAQWKQDGRHDHT